MRQVSQVGGASPGAGWAVDRHVGIRVPMAAALVPVLLGTLGGPTARPDGPPVPAPGYHHLGATTEGRWSGPPGRLAGGNPTRRPDSVDLVATPLTANAN